MPNLARPNSLRRYHPNGSPSDGARYITGDLIHVDGGQHLPAGTVARPTYPYSNHDNCAQLITLLDEIRSLK